jgi:hypothetical protein
MGWTGVRFLLVPLGKEFEYVTNELTIDSATLHAALNLCPQGFTCSLLAGLEKDLQDWKDKGTILHPSLAGNMEQNDAVGYALGDYSSLQSQLPAILERAEETICSVHETKGFIARHHPRDGSYNPYCNCRGRRITKGI